MRLTLDLDALAGTLEAGQIDERLIPALQAWVGNRWALHGEHTSDPGQVLSTLQEQGINLLHVIERPPQSPAEWAENAVVEPGAALGSLCRVWRFSHIRSGAALGAAVNVGQGVYVDTGVVTGARCKIQNGVNLYRGVVLGDDVFVGPAATFTNDRNPRARTDWTLTPTLVGLGASIGANATIVCGNHLGPWCMVAAGAVVTRPVPAYALVAGVPARLTGYVCPCGQRALPDRGSRYICPTCGFQVPEGSLNPPGAAPNI